jgi:hypothetical protein
MFKRKNCGTTDRIARVVIGAAIGAAYLMGWIQGTIALVAGLLALVMIGTGAVGYCAMYEPLGIDTRENKDDE